ncbi:MAG: thermonuclease family protein [Vicinamibacteraceae bacterium]
MNHRGVRHLATVGLLTAVPTIAWAQSGTRPQELTVVEEVFEATVIAIVDGDTLVVNDARGRLSLHLDGIDAPEIDQALGREAKALLGQLAARQVATVRVKSRAPAGGESIARLQVKGTDLSLALLEAGLAWYCRRHTGNPDMQRAETAAKLEKKGLWRASRPMPPWWHRGAANCRQDTHVPR